MPSAISVNNFQAKPVDVSTFNVSDPYGSGYVSTGKSFGDQLVKFFSGLDQEAAYQNALTENNRRYELALLENQRNYETWFDSTAVQRRVNDIKAAGLNPWLALQSGGISANGSASGSANPGSGSTAKSQSSGRSQIMSLAMLLVSTARLLATL